jgi:hypothetical protein
MSKVNFKEEPKAGVNQIMYRSYDYWTKTGTMVIVNEGSKLHKKLMELEEKENNTDEKGGKEEKVA